jgi:hypothetical protein
MIASRTVVCVVCGLRDPEAARSPRYDLYMPPSKRSGDANQLGKLIVEIAHSSSRT